MRCDELCIADSTTPALNRGLAILSILAERGALSLDQISKQLNLPKASVFRLLESLQKMALINKNSERQYEALWTLQPRCDALELERRKLKKLMPILCQQSQCTAEWYEPTRDGMKLHLQYFPDCEAQVRVRPGYLREWGVECEAVSKLGYAFADEAPRPAGLQMYLTNGKLVSVSDTKVKKMVEQARISKESHDIKFNANGVRRVACASFSEIDHSFLGVIVLAQCYSFGQVKECDALLQIIRRLIN